MEKKQLSRLTSALSEEVAHADGEDLPFSRFLGASALAPMEAAGVTPELIKILPLRPKHDGHNVKHS